MRTGSVAATKMAAGLGLKAYTADALEKLHVATLDILRTTGVSVE